ncbi:thioredoxin family protein [Streptomyces spectabilis]|uniref:Thiol-disulfide isomerase/thioredoxin n=1 Tax=Streptomyces spectabilis TaxID=68270 RepID=A0A7W8AP45_STRST|nr:thioredoxin family protein [Streptomyces spectabilis]MBB5101912.1 thiol-disulfide isomerase/thioredoxin [Streptomyces spectabilis]MCI3906964.1 thioredoxin family protein [Streptomyces spectabilis]
MTAARARGSERTLGAGDLGEPLGERATLVQFSSAFCQPCRATRRVLADVAAMVPGVAHVEIDAEGALELVRELRVLKTPTVLVLDRAGRVVRRAVGQPRRADVIAALGAAV